MQFFDLNSYIVDMIYELVPGVRRQSSNQLNFRCPICGDGKKKQSRRGHFYLNECTYYCWNAGCPANGKGFSGLQFLSALTKKSQSAIKSELIKRAGSLHSTLIIDDNKPVSKTQSENSMADLFNELSIKKQEKETFINKQLLDNNWTTLPEWVQTEVEKRKIYKSPYIKRNWELFYDKRTNRLVIPWTDEYYQLRALTKKQEKESGKYLFPPEIEKPIFGLDLIDPSFKYIFLLEGVFDAIFVRNRMCSWFFKIIE